MAEKEDMRSRWIGFAVCLAIAAAAFFTPAPDGLTVQGWRLLGIFVATIVSFLLRPFPMGLMVMLALTGLAFTGTLEFESILVGGFSKKVVWLVVAAFLIAGAVGRTGFGRRIALTLVTWFGRSTLGLGYAIGAAELALGPVVPSNTARGGGILAPIVDSLSRALGSSATESPERAGRYLVLVGSHANLITAAMFLTGMAANGLVADAASKHLGVDFGWGTWALGAIVPGLVGLALLPLFVYRLAKPTITDAGAAQEQARSSLAEMGPWSRGQITLAVVFVLMLALWTTKSLHGFHEGLVAWIGVCALIVTGTEKWSDVTGNAKAWDTLIWLGGLLAMANALGDTGVVLYFQEMMQGQVAGLAPVAVVLALCLVYFYSMYAFSMFTAHISAFVVAFFVVAASTQAPPLLMAAMFGYFSNLCGCTTNYSTGPVVIYFGLGYVPVGQWFRIGALMSLFHLSIWLTVGMAWWKFLGWW